MLCMFLEPIVTERQLHLEPKKKVKLFGKLLNFMKMNFSKAKNVKIKVQKPEAVRFEQSFEGLRFVGTQEVGQHAFDNPVEFRFTGSGVVLTGRLRNKQGGDYGAVVDVEIDGKPYTTVNIIEDDFRGQDHIFHAYGLEDREHTVKVSVRNPRADKKVWCGRLNIYRNK